MRPPLRRGLLIIAGGLALTAWVYRPLFSGALLVGRDAFRLFIPARAFLLDSLSRGELPLWNPYVRLGQPFAASLLPQAFYPPTWLTSALFGAAGGFTVQQLLHVLLAAGGAWYAARALRCSRPASAVAALVFGFSPLLTDLNGHRNVVDAAAWTGWMVAAAVRLARSRRDPSAAAPAGGTPGVDARGLSGGISRVDATAIDVGTSSVEAKGLDGGASSVDARGATLHTLLPLPALLLAVFTTLSFLAGSPETLVWQLLLVGMVFAFQRPTSGAWQSAGVAALVCLGLSAFLLVPAVEFLRLTTRGAGSADAVDWSASWAQLLAMGWPRADLPRGEYWGDDQWWMVTVFVGTAPALLALTSLGRNKRVLGVALATALLAALALGKHLPLTAWLWTHGPLGAFRFPAKFLVGVSFGMALLAALGTDRVAALLRRRGTSVGWMGAVLGLGLVGVLAGPALLRLVGARAGATQGLLWVLVTACCLALVVLAPAASVRRASWVRVLLLAVVALELVVHHGLNTGFGWERPERLLAPSVLAAAIPEHFQGRISLPMTDALVGPRDPSLPSFIDSSRDALIPNRHMEEQLLALEGYGAPEPRWLNEFQLVGKRSVFDLTGVAYYVRSGPPPYADLEQVAGGPGLPALYRSSTALPRAFVVHRAQVVDAQTALEKVWEESQPARETVFLQQGTALEAPCTGSSARIVASTAQRVEVEVDSCGPGYLVLSDAFFPGWRAWSGDSEVEVLRADYALRSVAVSSGKQRVTFRYQPVSLRVGAGLTLLTLLALGAAARFRRRWN